MATETGGNVLREMLRDYELEDWWFSTFTDEEQQYIQELHQLHDPSGDYLEFEGEVFLKRSHLNFLSRMATWFLTKEDWPIARKILVKAEEYFEHEGKRPLDYHFLCLEKINIYYRFREIPEYIGKAIQACEDQIAYAPVAKNNLNLSLKMDGCQPTLDINS